MRALVHVRDEELADRRAKGLDRWDETWEGVLHMTPAPSYEHQRIVTSLIEFLGPLCRGARRGTLVAGVNVFRRRGDGSDYRIPDLTFVAAGREHVLGPEGIEGGGPDAVIEIRSPDDETYEKLPFYAAIGVREVIVCDRDSKQPRIFTLAGSEFAELQADDEGRVTSDVLGIRLQVMPGTPPRLRIEDRSTPASAFEI